jgi:hypothetical protein
LTSHRRENFAAMGFSLLQLPADFANLHTSAQLDFRELPLRFDVIPDKRISRGNDLLSQGAQRRGDSRRLL